jgi:hypothetical protein
VKSGEVLFVREAVLLTVSVLLLIRCGIQSGDLQPEAITPRTRGKRVCFSATNPNCRSERQ